MDKNIRIGTELNGVDKRETEKETERDIYNG